MNHAGDQELPSEQQDRLLDVIEGRRSVDDPEVRALMASDPRFREHVLGALDVSAALARLRAAEAEAVAAPTSSLEAVAVAAARAGFGLPPQRASGRQATRWPWFALALAAGLALAVLWWNGSGSGARRDGPSHLGGTAKVAVSLVGQELVFAPAPQVGQHYEVIVEGELARDPFTVRRSDRFALPDLSKYGRNVRVQVSLMQGDDKLLGSDPLPLPPRDGR